MILDHVLPVCCGNYSYMIPDWNQVAFGRTAVSLSLKSRQQKLFFDANLSSKLPIASYPKVMSMCKARSNKRNPDFSRKYRGSSSKNKRQGQERENPENQEDSLFPSKNGPLISLPNTPRYSATATPGRREKEIVELFRKVQLRLRERAAIKEEKRVEAAQHGSGERGTVDSLLKLLRKHSVAQGKKGSSSDDGYNLDPPERSDPFDEPETTDLFEEEQPHSSFFESHNLRTSQTVVHEQNTSPSIRPISNFKRKSPVPKVKFQPVLSAEEEGSSSSSILNLEKKIKDVDISSELNLPPESQTWHILESHDDPTTKVGGLDGDDDCEDSSDSDEIDMGMSQVSFIQDTDLSSMKVSQLRGLAKSKGIKGYSRLKKIELLELLTLNSA